MLRTIFLIASLAFAVVLIGCSTTVTTNENKATGTDKPASSTTSTPATTTASSTGDKIGVPECDDFIAKYDECVSNKVPEMARAQYKSAIQQWKTSWKQLAENPQTKGTLASACKQAAEQQNAALKSFGCTF
ncbi:MAG TPA: hypothetical protein VJT71_05190 [Pyrinomonadaceae bacterium]|nr:hypothetical protein [Pyrinomonadaceae bacterium]